MGPRPPRILRSAGSVSTSAPHAGSSTWPNRRWQTSPGSPTPPSGRSSAAQAGARSRRCSPCSASWAWTSRPAGERPGPRLARADQHGRLPQPRPSPHTTSTCICCSRGSPATEISTRRTSPSSRRRAGAGRSLPAGRGGGHAEGARGRRGRGPRPPALRWVAVEQSRARTAAPTGGAEGPTPGPARCQAPTCPGCGTSPYTCSEAPVAERQAVTLSPARENLGGLSGGELLRARHPVARTFSASSSARLRPIRQL